MKIAVISDIHGNLEALETVLKDINKRKADKIICLGDIIGKGPDTKETIDICRNECDIMIKGNWEDGFYYQYIELNQGRARESEVRADIIWYINDVGSDRMEYLGTLPHFTEFYLSGRLIRLFHAHPKNFNRYFPDSPIEKRLELFDYNDSSDIKKPADVAVYADIHTVYMQFIESRFLLNAGSVGNPLDIPQASYVIIEDEPSFNIQFIRVPYDIEKTVKRAKERDIPHLDGYMTELRKAKYFKR